MSSNGSPKHVVGLVGGAVSGSVCAEILANKGVEVVLIEQNDRPYGKIEDGLPRWHAKQRKMEYGKIDKRLDRENIHFVPRTTLGEDVDFLDLAQKWGFSALLLANGAWRDRSLPVDGADEYIDKGLVYQNPFIYWFNHKNEKSFSGQRYEVPDGTLCVGGGLASIDCIKVIQLEIYERALRKRGIEVDMYHLEHKGIAKTLEEHDIKPEDLDLTNGKLIYRRRVEDMPLGPVPKDQTPEQVAKTEMTRKKILEKCRAKYLFDFSDKTLPTGLIVEDGQLVGLTASNTLVEGRKATPIEGSEHELRAPLIISSIGSVPAKIPGVEMKGEYYVFKDWDTGEYAPVPGVYGVGNVVTGQGNIVASFKHGQFVGNYLIESYLGIAEGEGGDAVAAGQAAAEGRGEAGAEAVAGHLEKREPLPAEKVDEILGRVKNRQKEVGFESYKAWIEKNTPDDLE